MTPEWERRIGWPTTNGAQSGMRVLGAAIRTLDALPSKASDENVETGLILVGHDRHDRPAREPKCARRCRVPHRGHSPGDDHRRSPADGAAYRPDWALRLAGREPDAS